MDFDPSFTFEELSHFLDSFVEVLWINIWVVGHGNVAIVRGHFVINFIKLLIQYKFLVYKLKKPPPSEFLTPTQ